MKGQVLITDAHTIQKHAVTHFQQYALPDTIQPPINERWFAQYAPKSFINEDWFQSIMSPPTWDE